MSDQRVSYCLRLPPELYDFIDWLSKRRGTSMNDEYNRLVREEMERYKKPQAKSVKV